MIDREGAGAGFFRRSRSSEPADEYPQQSGLSNKAMVYLVIMALIVILCIVYVFQLRSARHLPKRLRREKRKHPRRHPQKKPNRRLRNKYRSSWP